MIRSLFALLFAAIVALALTTVIYAVTSEFWAKPLCAKLGRQGTFQPAPALPWNQKKPYTHLSRCTYLDEGGTVQTTNLNRLAALYDPRYLAINRTLVFLALFCLVGRFTIQKWG